MKVNIVATVTLNTTTLFFFFSKSSSIFLFISVNLFIFLESQHCYYYYYYYLLHWRLKLIHFHLHTHVIVRLCYQLGTHGFTLIRMYVILFLYSVESLSLSYMTTIVIIGCPDGVDASSNVFEHSYYCS